MARRVFKNHTTTTAQIQIMVHARAELRPVLAQARARAQDNTYYILPSSDMFEYVYLRFRAGEAQAV